MLAIEIILILKLILLTIIIMIIRVMTNEIAFQLMMS